MARWAHTIRIRQYLGEGEDKAAQIASAKGIAKEVEALPDALWQRGGKDCCKELMKAARTGNINWFNASLDRLWDWLDKKRIWVEL